MEQSEQERQARLEAVRRRIEARFALVESIIEDIRESRSRQVGHWMIGDRRQRRNTAGAIF